MRRSGGADGAWAPGADGAWAPGAARRRLAAQRLLVTLVTTLAVFMTALLGTSALADGEQMLLPFQCTIDRGRIVLTPSAERAYRLAGPRASHAFTACAPANPNRCRTWQIHKFDFACAGQRVPWLTVAGAMLERMAQRGRIENGRLMLRLGPEWQRRAVVPVGFRHPFNDAEQLLAFPAGFAPALGSSVRFVGSSGPQPTVVDAKPELKPEAVKQEATRPEATRPEAIRTEPKLARTEPRSGPSQPPPTSKSRDPGISEGWGATVTPATSLAAVETAAGTFMLQRGLVGFALVLAAWGGLLWVRRRTPSQTAAAPHSEDGLRSPTPGASATSTSPSSNSPDDAALCAELVARAVNLHQAAREAVGALPNLNLREILTNDLAAVQRCLLSAELTTNVAEERWDVVKPALSKALADLERIARIISGVLSSQPVAGQPMTGPSPVQGIETVAPLVLRCSVPETTHEAFEMLGVNPEASRTVVKKVVDGLRQSWHPDHARDAEDRARRDERMKQINIAWDLIRTARERETTETEQAA